MIFINHSFTSSLPQNLGSLHNLRILSVQSNRIVKLEGLGALEKLEELYMSHNGIEKLEGLDRNVSKLDAGHA